MPLELRPHQVDVLDKIHNGCVLKGVPGSGKSYAALVYFFQNVCGGKLEINGVGQETKMTHPKDLYIITTAKKRDGLDWMKDCSDLGISSNKETSWGGVGVVVDSWNQIYKYTEVKDAFFILDEQRLVGHGSWVKAFLKIAKTNQWIMLSATPGDTWLDYVPVFIANGFYRNRTEFFRRHVVYNNFSKFPKVDHYVEVPVLESLRSRVLVEMPYKRHTTRHIETILVNYDREVLDEIIIKRRWNVFENRPIKDVSELFIVMRKFVNSDVSRLAALMALMEKHPRLIVFYNYDYELAMLRGLRDALEVPYAEWNGHKHQEIPDTDKWLYVVQYTAGAEGWNCVSTDSMVFWSLNYSYKLNEQAKGRTDRLNTPFVDLWYYIFESESRIDREIRRSLRSKRSFNEKAFVRTFG